MTMVLSPPSHARRSRRHVTILGVQEASGATGTPVGLVASAVVLPLDGAWPRAATCDGTGEPDVFGMPV